MNRARESRFPKEFYADLFVCFGFVKVSRVDGLLNSFRGMKRFFYCEFNRLEF